MKKRVLALICMITVMITALTGCGSNDSAKEESGKNEIALVVATGSIDDKSFNQGSWEGVIKYAQEHDITYKYYQAIDQSDDAITNAMKLAVNGGAKVVICPGYYFEVPLYTFQEQYPDVTFIILDGAPNDGNGTTLVKDNVTAITYAEQEAGFLAGYAAVKDGYRNLGFMGGIALPAVVRYGYGFVQGAEYAAAELGLSKEEVAIKYTYVGNFDASPDNMAKAAGWYGDGTEVIFACGGSVGNSVMKAAATSGGKVIGVDVDQSSESDTVITSAMKNLNKSVYDALTDYYNGTLMTGETLILDVTTNNILLPMETSLFTNFTKDDYSTIYETLVNRQVSILKNEAAETVNDLPVELVTVNLIQ